MRVAAACIAGVAVAAGCADPPDLSTTEQELVTVNPASWDFGTVDFGVEAGPRSVTVAPGVGANYDVVVGIYESCPDFRYDLLGQVLPYEVYRECEYEGPPQVAPCQTIAYQSLTFDTYFAPTIPGLQSCVVAIDLEFGTDRTVSLSGTGVAPPVDITLAQPSSGSLHLGDAVVNNDSSPGTISVRNDGAQTLDVTGASMFTNPGGQFTVASGPPSAALGQGQTSSWTVTCRPAATGPVQAGTFRITSSDPDEPVVDVQLQCNGIQSNLAIAPSTVLLGETRVGETSMQTITLDNTGATTLTIDSVTVTGAGMSVTQPATTMLATGGQTSVDVSFSPTGDGDVVGDVTVTYSGDGGAPRVVPVTGPGRVSILSITPSGVVDFGPICDGDTEDQLFFALNTGTGAFDVSAIAADGGFVATPLSPPTFPAALPPLGAGVVNFRVTGGSTTPGPLAGQLTVTTDIPTQADHVVELAGVALAAGIGVTPVELDAGAAMIGDGAGGRKVTLSNCDTTALSIVSTSIDGPNADEFHVVTEPASTDLQPSSSAEWVIELRPTSRGAKEATFHIVHTGAGGMVDVPLFGDGIADLDGDGDRGSYYACSASGGGGGAAIVLAVLVTCRRRRACRATSRARTSPG
jgi:hypothetical protein